MVSFHTRILDKMRGRYREGSICMIATKKANADDQVFPGEGVEIHVNKADVSRLLGSEIDYVDGLNGAGFKISNPNVKGSCGCGKSQSY